MAGSNFGQHFRITTFGESHGPCVGVVIDGCPAGLEIDLDFVQKQLSRRRPGQSNITTQRKEEDKVEFFSGVFEGKTTGTPIMAAVFNKDARSKDYSHLKDVFRPSHADFTFTKKYGHRDYQGGGRASARETVARVIAGAIAQQVLKSFNIEIHAGVVQVADLQVESFRDQWDWAKIDETPIRCPEPKTAKKMVQKVEEARKEGDSLGGVIFCEILNTPAGLGEPVFDKLTADLAKAMMSINATRGFEVGSGFQGVSLKGSEHNDVFYKEKGEVKTRTNNSGGIQGGISNGMPIYFQVAFKPTATILKDQESVNVKGESTQVVGRGRHDPCVLPRAVPIVETMAALVLLDHYLRARTNRMDQLGDTGD